MNGAAVVDLWEYRHRRANPWLLVAPLSAAVRDASPGDRVRVLAHVARVVMRHVDAGRLPLPEAFATLNQAAAEAGMSEPQRRLVLMAAAYGPGRPAEPTEHHGTPGGSA